jgi:hypothetical protein
MTIKKAIDILADFDIKKFAKDKEKKKDPKAKTRNRGKCCCPAEHPKVNDKKDHYPINNEGQARNALSRVNQHKSAPSWWDGSVKSLIDTVYRCVKSHYKKIKVDDDKKSPGKD